MSRSTEQFLSHLQARLDKAAIVAGAAVDQRYSDDLSGGTGARPELVLRPRSTPRYGFS